MSKILLELDLAEDATTMADILGTEASNQYAFLSRLVNHLEGLRSGSKEGFIQAKVGAVQASIVGTFTDNPTAADTVTINGTVITARASGAIADEFNLVNGGTAAADAAGNATALAAAINASTGLSGYVVATASAGAVTIKARDPGVLGNAIVIAESMGNFTFAGGAVKLAGGTQGSDTAYGYGKTRS